MDPALPGAVPGHRVIQTIRAIAFLPREDILANPVIEP
jgi:hypothetical protein